MQAVLDRHHRELRGVVLLRQVRKEDEPPFLIFGLQAGDAHQAQGVPGFDVAADQYAGCGQKLFSRSADRDRV